MICVLNVADLLGKYVLIECGRPTWEICFECGGEYCAVHIDNHVCSLFMEEECEE
jgi:hypothetical protein